MHVTFFVLLVPQVSRNIKAMPIILDDGSTSLTFSDVRFY